MSGAVIAATGPRPAAAPRRARTALGVWTQKELRDLLPLAIGVAVAALGAALAWARYGRRFVELAPETAALALAAAAVLCMLPIAAEALTADTRHGTARAAQGWPANAARTSAAKALALALYGVGFATLIGITAALVERPVLASTELAPRVLRGDLTPLAGLALRAAGMALVAVVVAAAVTRHGLASLLVGVGVLLLHATLLWSRTEGGLQVAPTWAAARARALYLDVSAPAAAGWTLALLAAAAPALALRGPLARSVARRASTAALAVTVVVAIWWSRPVAGAERAAVRPFDDPRACIEDVLVAPNGARLAVTLRHDVPHRHAAMTWWLVEPDLDAPPRRLSTLDVAESTGLGTGPPVELIAWSRDGAALIGTSSLRDEVSAYATSWQLDPTHGALSRMRWDEYSVAIGDTLQRRRAPDWTAESPREIWTLRDGPETLTVPAATRLGSILGARGIGYFLDPAGTLHRADVVAGEVRALGVTAFPLGRLQFDFSQDGRHVVYSARGDHESVLLDTETGASVSFESGRFFFGAADATVLLPLDRTGAPMHGQTRKPTQRWRAVSTSIVREIDFGVAVEPCELCVLADGRIVARSGDRQVLTLHDTDGALVRTLRAPREEVQR